MVASRGSRVRSVGRSGLAPANVSALNEERDTTGRLTKMGLLMIWLCCFSSALAVVFVTFDARQKTQALEELRSEEIKLRVTYGQFQLEKSSLASYPRVEAIANESLNMSLPDAGETVLVIRE